MKFAAVSGQVSAGRIAAARIHGVRTGPSAMRVGRWHRLAVRADVDRTKVLEEVRDIICEQLGAEKEDVTGDAKFADIGADSLDTVEIMMKLEETYDIQLDEEAAEQLQTVQDAASLISDLVEKK